MKNDKQTKPVKSEGVASTKKAAQKKSGATDASMDLPTATSKARARNGRSLPNEGTINSYEEDVTSAS